MGEESRLNIAVPELLKMAQRWVGKSELKGKKWVAPGGYANRRPRRPELTLGSLVF